VRDYVTIYFIFCFSRTCPSSRTRAAASAPYPTSGKIERDGRVPAGAARKRARKAERARKAAKRGGPEERDSKMGDVDAAAAAASSRAWILTEGRPQPFCSLCKIDIADTPKAMKAHLKSKPHKTALRSVQPEQQEKVQEKTEKKEKKHKKDKKDKREKSESESESSDSVCVCVTRAAL